MIPCFTSSLGLGEPLAACPVSSSVSLTNHFIGQPPPSEIKGLLTQKQHDALKILKDDGEREVFAWLKLARSVEQLGHRGHGHEILSAEKVRAIDALRGCAIEDVCTWLDGCRAIRSHDQAHASQRSGPPELGYAAAETPHDVTYSSNSHSLYNPRQISAKDATLAPSSSTKPTNVPRPYQCTECLSQRAFKNSSDWQKHEKEHEYTFICAFCVMEDSSGNLTGNECQLMSSLDHGSYSYKRRDALVRHLSRHHGIHDVDQGRARANTWRRNSRKKVWSCGFCVQLFTSFLERLRHIGTDHFDKHQSIKDWSMTNVVMGLLLQPGVKEAWDNVMALNHPWGSPVLEWAKADVGNLQLRLEMGPSNFHGPKELAHAAYTAARLNGTLVGQVEMNTSAAIAKRTQAPEIGFPQSPFTSMLQARLTLPPKVDDHSALGIVANSLMLESSYSQTTAQSTDPSIISGFDDAFASSDFFSGSHHIYNNDEDLFDVPGYLN